MRDGSLPDGDVGPDRGVPVTGLLLGKVGTILVLVFIFRFGVLVTEVGIFPGTGVAGGGERDA
jgi:hypothetical protein